MRNLRDPSPNLDCLSDLTLDRLLTGELAPDRLHPAEQHLLRCEACRARHEAMKAVALSYFADPRSELTLARLTPARTGARKRRRSWALMAAGIAAMLGLALLPAREDGAATRSKGRLAFGFFVKRGERVFRGMSGDAVLSGDQLRFTVRPERAGYVAILSLDERGVVDVFYPASDQPLPVQPRELETALSTSVLLDETLGEEQVYALLCEHAPDVTELRRSLALHHALLAPVGCQLETMRLRKVRASP